MQKKPIVLAFCFLNWTFSNGFLFSKLSVFKNNWLHFLHQCLNRQSSSCKMTFHKAVCYSVDWSKLFKTENVKKKLQYPVLRSSNSTSLQKYRLEFFLHWFSDEISICEVAFEWNMSGIHRSIEIVVSRRSQDLPSAFTFLDFPNFSKTHWFIFFYGYPTRQ